MTQYTGDPLALPPACLLANGREHFTLYLRPGDSPLQTGFESIMKKFPLTKSVTLLVFSVACALAQSQTSSPNAASNGTALRRVQVDADTASSLVLQKTSIKYPDAARNAGIEGTVVLKVVTAYSGDVKEVTVVSGDLVLAQAATEAVKQWKYKPYLQEGSAAEMETEVSLNFHIKPRLEPVSVPLGQFHDNAYSNDYFGIYYPLSRDWVSETQLIRKREDPEGKARDTGVLLSVVYIPKDAPRADSTFTVVALRRARAPAPDECKRYLGLVADELHSRKEGQQKGDLTQFNTAGHEFYRGDFVYPSGTEHGALLCTAIKDYLLQWNIRGWSKQAIESAVSTLNSIAPASPVPAQSGPATSRQPEDDAPGHPKSPQRVRVAEGVLRGRVIKQIRPIYPVEARNAHIQGTVRLHAIINKNGDIADLEVLGGPIELVVSAVNAVRQGKYHPYLLMGNLVEVDTEMNVNYTLSRQPGSP